MRTAWLPFVLVGCAYQPGSFAPQAAFPGARTTVGCIDVAVERRADLPLGPVLGYHFANRCDRAVVIDLAAVAVVGRGADGADVALRPYDPQHELAPAALDGRSVGGEAIAYPAVQALAQLCVDVAALARQPPAQWLCLGAASPASAAATAARATQPAAVAAPPMAINGSAP